MLKIAIILGSTRPNRNGEAVARWVFDLARQRGDAEYELIDLREVNLPLLDEPRSPAMGRYERPHTQAWAARIRPFDGFVLVSPEYNHSTSAALKNALDFIYAEWNNKAAAFVAYGSAGGTRAVEHLRGICAELQVATVRQQVALSLHSDFKDMREFTPGAHHARSVDTMLRQLLAWAGALRTLRQAQS